MPSPKISTNASRRQSGGWRRRIDPPPAAFKQPDFSTDIASIAGTPAYTLRRFRAGCGLVLFNYGDAKAIGFLAHQEVDPHHRENLAHANVYNNSAASTRKTMAQKLIAKIVEKNGIVKVPDFPSSSQ